MNKTKFALLVIFEMLLGACASPNVFEESDPVKESVLEGIPYNLPKSLIELNLSVGEGEGGELGFKVSARSKLVPDPEEIYVLDPATNSFLVSSEHDIVLENGMLKSINTIDTGEAGSIIENASTTLVNIAKSVAAAQSGGQDAFSDFQPNPTIGEIEAIIEMLAQGSVSFMFDPGTGIGEAYQVPGTDGLLVLAVGRKEFRQVFSWRDRRERSSIVESFDAGIDLLNVKASCEKILSDGYEFGYDNFDLVHEPPISVSALDTPKLRKVSPSKSGLYTKTLQAYELSAQLYIDMSKLRLLRATKAFDEFQDSRIEVANIFNASRSVQNKTALACSTEFDSSKFHMNKRELEEEIDRLEKLKVFMESDGLESDIDHLINLSTAKLDELIKSQNACLTAKELLDQAEENISRECINLADREFQLNRLENWNPEPFFLLSSIDHSIQVAGDMAIPIPVTRASIGQTTNRLMFDSGILLDYHQDKSSEGKVLTESLVNATNTLYDGVVEVLKIPTQVLGIEAEELRATQELTDEQILLNNKLDRLDGTRAEIQNVLLNAQLEAVQANPSEYFDLIDDVGLQIGESDPDPDPDPDPDIESDPDPDPSADPDLKTDSGAQ